MAKCKLTKTNQNAWQHREPAERFTHIDPIINSFHGAQNSSIQGIRARNIFNWFIFREFTGNRLKNSYLYYQGQKVQLDEYNLEGTHTQLSTKYYTALKCLKFQNFPTHTKQPSLSNLWSLVPKMHQDGKISWYTNITLPINMKYAPVAAKSLS